MHINDRTAPISQAEKSTFFEKIFKEHHIALIGSNNVERVALQNDTWIKQRVKFHFASSEVVCYCIGRYIIVWRGHSSVPLFLGEFEEPFSVAPLGGYNFMLRKHLANNDLAFERYAWSPSAQMYEVTSYAPDEITREFDNLQFCLPPAEEILWNRIYPHEDEETQSVDNRIFYDFIVKYWED